MERNVEPTTLPQTGEEGDPVDASSNSDITLAAMLSAVTLGDPDIDHVRWCAQFRQWRAIKRFSAYAGVSMLQPHLPETTYWGVSSIDIEWRLSGRSKPQTAEDWEDYLAFSLELVSARACFGVPPTKESLIIQWEGLVQGDQDAVQFAKSILQLADQFKQLKSPIIKSIREIQEKLMAGASRSLRVYWQTAKLFVNPAKENSPDEEKQALIRLALKARAFEAILAEEGTHIDHHVA